MRWTRCAAVAAQVSIAFLLVPACATAPVDRERLASVHTIYFGAIIEPPDRPFFEKAGGPPRSLLGRANVAVDGRNAIGAALIKEGYQFVPDERSADAVLSVIIKVADYMPDAPFGRDCKPIMLIGTKLTDARGETLLEREYDYVDTATVPRLPGYVLLRADPKYTDPSCSNYSQERVIAAFHDVVPLLAQAISSELAKR